MISNSEINITNLNIYSDINSLKGEVQSVKDELKNEINSLFSDVLSEVSSAISNDTKIDTITDDSESDSVINIENLNIYLNNEDDVLNFIDNIDSATKQTSNFSSSFSSDFSNLKFSVPNEYKELINNAADKYKISADVIASVIYAESSFNTNAVSKSGAKGLMQLMPETAKEVGVSNSFDVAQNIDGGTKYLSKMLKRFDNDLSLALAAYNAGAGNVSKYKGIPPFEETQNYVSKIIKNIQY